ncbi:hypothetical protein ACLOJK_015280 [Asimina triloba]
MSSPTAAAKEERTNPPAPAPAPPPSETSASKARLAIQSLYIILGDPLPSSLSSPHLGPPPSLLHDPELGSKVTSRLRQPLSGAGNDNICRWLYDTFQSADPDLQLAVLRFLPTLAGVYLIRAVARKPLAGFEAVLLALYAHVTKTRSAQPLTVTIPDISHSSLYHESCMKMPMKNSATELSIAVVSPSLEPHGTIRSTRRARIVGVTLELYYSKISQMPVASKIDFSEFCEVWAGQDGRGMFKEVKEEEEEEVLVDKCSNSVKEDCGEKGGRIPLPWELLQPSLRILGHCMLGQARWSKELKKAAWAAIRSLYMRALHDLNPQAILATESLLKLGRREMESLLAQGAAEMDRSISTNSKESLVVFST